MTTLTRPDMRNPRETVAYRSVSIIILLSFLINFSIFLITKSVNATLDSWEYSELMISYRGGFVRRGLIGEILMWLTELTGLPPQYIIFPVCLLIYGFVLYFLFSRFRKRGYCWWILLSPLMCGFVSDIVRKDYLLFAILIGMLWLVRNGNASPAKRMTATALAIIGLLVHEAFLFWGVPVFVLVLLTQKHQRGINIALVVLILAVFAILCIFKDDSETANAIISSWNKILSPENRMTFIRLNSIGALTWELPATILNHINNNTGGAGQYYLGVLFWPICYLIVYYLITFFFTAFPPSRTKFGETSRTQLSFILLLISICLLPMFTVLSCDYGRLFQYLAAASFSCYLILDEDVKHRIMPDRATVGIVKLNTTLSRLYTPSKGLLATLLLLLGISRSYFDIYYCMMASPAGTIFRAIRVTLQYIFV